MEVRNALPFNNGVVAPDLSESASHERGPSRLDETVDMASDLDNPFELDPELDTLLDTGASTMFGVLKTNVHTDTKLNAYTPDTGAGDILRVLSLDHPAHTKIALLTIHQNKKVQAFASDPQNTKLLHTVAEYHASDGAHNRELREQYHAFKFPV